MPALTWPGFGKSLERLPDIAARSRATCAAAAPRQPPWEHVPGRPPHPPPVFCPAARKQSPPALNHEDAAEPRNMTTLQAQWAPPPLTTSGRPNYRRAVGIRDLAGMKGHQVPVCGIGKM